MHLPCFAGTVEVDEHVKTFVPRSLALVGCASLFFASSALAAENSNSFWPLSGEYTADATYVRERDVERNPRKKVSDFDEIDSDIRLVLTPRPQVGVLRLGAEWQRFSFGLPQGAALPNTLQSFSTLIGLDMQFSAPIIVRADTQPGLYISG